MNYSQISAENFNNLQQKISEYQTSLITLQKGYTTENILLMKNELDDLKKQISIIDNIQQLEVAKSNLGAGSKENVPNITLQLESLNKSIEEISTEILNILNNVTQNNTTNFGRKNIETVEVDNKLLLNEKIQSEENKKPLNISSIPSFKDLQRIAGKIIVGNDIVENDLATGHPNGEEIILRGKHFNGQYFQATKTYPTHINNGLYKNVNLKPTIRFKNAYEKAKEILDENNHRTTSFTNNNREQSFSVETISNEKREKTEDIIPAIEDVEIPAIDDVIIPAIDNEIFLAKDDEIIRTIDNELIEEQLPEEEKKERTNSFLNFLRKWTNGSSQN